jgi:predicted ATPase
VAYESQLKSDSAQWHRRLAEAIESREPESADQNAALIAKHWEAAGELQAAYGWHMRAGARSANRDLGAARVSWERAHRIADALPDDPDQLSMRIAPRTTLCATDWQDQQSRKAGGYSHRRPAPTPCPRLPNQRESVRLTQAMAGKGVSALT